MMSYKNYHARIDFDDVDEIFFGRIAGINDVVGFHADNVAGLKAAFHEAVEDYIATCALTGKKPEKTYSGKMMFRVNPQVHANASLAAETSGQSLNQWAEQVLSDAANKVVG